MVADNPRHRIPPPMIFCDCGCGVKFTPSNKDHRFYSGTCRAKWHREQNYDGEVTGMRPLKRGGWSVTIHYPHQPQGLQIGSQVRVEKADQARTNAS